MSVHGHGVTDVKLGYIPFPPFINEPPFIWKNLKPSLLLKFLGGPLQKEGGQTINDEGQTSNSGI